MASKLQRLMAPQPSQFLVDFEREQREIEARERADREHQQPGIGHAISEQRCEPCGLSCYRQACSCGWKGAWFHV